MIAGSPPNIKKVKNTKASENSIEKLEYGKFSIILGARNTAIARSIKNSRLKMTCLELKSAYRKHNPPRLIIKRLKKFSFSFWLIDTGETIGMSVIWI
jgi:hypothetical protein